MTQYAVTLTQTVGHTIYVEAATEDEARDLAEGIGTGSLCHQCADITDLDSHGWEASFVEVSE
jgi:hypothetical protein